MPDFRRLVEAEIGVYNVLLLEKYFSVFISAYFILVTCSVPFVFIYHIIPVEFR